MVKVDAFASGSFVSITMSPGLKSTLVSNVNVSKALAVTPLES